MNIVSYARVSTLRQESEQQSLVNQERAFAAFLERGGHRRLRAYRDAASAKSVEGRIEFQRMVADLAELRPDAVIVDTLDRFTRNLRDGLNLLHELRGHGVGLLPLDWRREHPIAIDDDRDWAEVVEEFTGAERERRRIRRRVVRSYEGRRERGATTHNKVPFGVRKDGDRLVPSDDAWVVQEFERRVLAGEGIHAVGRAIRALHPKAWQSDASLKRILKNPAYLEAGVRTQERAKALLALADQLTARFGITTKRRYDHEFTGVFRCPICEYRMHSIVKKNPERETIQCTRKLDHPGGSAYSLLIDEPFREQWLAVAACLEEAVNEWAAGESPDYAKQRRAYERQIATLDQRAADLKRRRDRAFDLLGDGDPALEAQARTMLRELNADETALEMQRSIALGDLARLPSPERRDPAVLRALLAQFRETYEAMPMRERNALNRDLCEVLGSNPTVSRAGLRRNAGRRIAIAWPEIVTPTTRKHNGRTALLG